MIDLMPGDNRDSLRRMIREGRFVHSVVTDPPYGLVSVTKRFGGKGASEAKFGSDGAFQRQSKGFMGKLWDGSGIERDPEFWKLVYDVMLPGAYIVAFASSRTYGYLQVAMEAAGFITHPMIGWLFGSGFPKGHDASRAIDQALGVKGSAGDPRVYADGHVQRSSEDKLAPPIGTFARVQDDRLQYLPGSPEAQQWDGWKYGTQSLKPALEPIYVGQKPFSEKNGALNILKHGVGAVNIDACRVESGPVEKHVRTTTVVSASSMAGVSTGSTGSGEFVSGRYPANLCHDGSDEVVALFPDSKGQQGRSLADGSPHGNSVYGVMTNAGPVHEPRNDSGSAARFFNSFPHEGPGFYYPKANKRDRAGSKHATVKPIGFIQHLQRMHTPPGGTTLDPFAGSGTSGAAAIAEGFDCVLMEAEHEYIRDITRRFGLPETLTTKLVDLGDAVERMIR